MKTFLILLAILGAVCASHSEPIEPEANSFLEFMTGFLEGLNVKGDISKILECVKGGEDIINKLMDALKHFQHIDILHIGDIIKGLELLISAVMEAIEIIKPCSQSSEEIKKLINALTHVDFKKLALKIIANAGQFIHDVTDAMAAFKAKEFKRAGKDIGDIMYRLFLQRVAVADPMYEFLRGFLEGINEKGDIKKLLECLNDLQPIVNEIIEALKLIMTMNISNVVKGVTMLVEAVTKFIKVLEPCSEGFTQLEKLLEAIINVDINKVVQKIIKDPMHYISDIYEWVAAFLKGDFYTAGKNLGDIVYRLFLAATLEASIDDFIQFVEGFLEGIDAAKHFVDIKDCIDKVPEVWNKILDVIEKIKKINWKSLDILVEALMELFDAFRKILEAIKPCSKVPGEVEELIKKIINVNIEKLLQKLQANAFQIISDIMAAVNHFKDLAYKSAGKDLGDILYILVFKE